MSENKKPRRHKPGWDLSAFFDEKGEEEFINWWESNTEKIEIFKMHPDDNYKVFLYAYAWFWYERVNEGWQDAIDLLGVQGDLINKLNAEIPEATKRGRLAATLEHWPAIQAEQKRLITLATKARPKAIEKRKKKAVENNAALDKAILDLLENHPHARSWTNDDIADWLAPKYPVYTRSTILQRVKKKAAEIRKKDRQNNQLPNR